MRYLLSLPVLLLVLPGSTRAQTSAVIDEGTFTISMKGAPVGRESFRIIRSPAPGGQVYLATGTSVIGELRTTTRLGTDSAGAPVSYQSETSRRGEVQHRLNGSGRPGRFNLLAQKSGGESAREYVLDNGALLLDEDVFNHFFFVALAAEHPQVIVISPRTARQVRLRLETGGADSVEIAGRRIAARRFALSDGSGSREVWVDSAGRVLRVVIAERGVVALRDDPPR